MKKIMRTGMQALLIAFLLSTSSSVAFGQELRPALKQTGIAESSFTSNTFDQNALNRLATDGIVFGPLSKGNVLQLQKGFVLFMPKSDIRLITKQATVNIPKGAHVWVMETETESAIYDLHDNTGRDCVHVLISASDISMLPGYELLMTKNTSAPFAAVNPGNIIRFRHVQAKQLKNGTKIFACEFSIPDCIHNVPSLRKLLRSDEPEHQKAMHSILKNATVIGDMTGFDYHN